MHDGLLLSMALAASSAGMGWLALSMDVHWAQVRAGASCPPTLATALRALGGASLLASLLLCLSVDSASIAVLVWLMALAGSTLAIAFLLTWRASVLGMLLFWTRQGVR